MKATLQILIFSFVAWNVGWAQKPGPLPEESLMLHLNTTFFLTGETLHFKIYCLDKNSSGKISQLSSVAYVELVGEDQQPLTQMKVRLEKGVGHGDFFFPGNIPSGNYMLIAYTKWMRNFDEKLFFHTTITVINPLIRPPVSDTSARVAVEGLREPQAHHDGLLLQTDKESYGIRERVSIKLANDTDVTMFLSANVRLLEPEINSAFSLGEFVTNNNGQPGLKEIRFLPEIRSELISGILKDKINGKPLAGALVSLSSPSQNFEFIMSTTDSIGRYYFNSRNIGSDYILLHPHSAPQGVIIEPDAEFLGKYISFTPPKLRIDSSMKKMINRRHVSLQVENAFYNAKKDSLAPMQKNGRFFGKPDKSYNLDDFTRFPSMEDVFREIIPQVVVKIRDGNFFLVMISGVNSYRFQNPPLVLVDGIPIDNTNAFMKYDPSLIKTISLITRRYYYGGLETEGIISVETFDGDAKNLPLGDLVRVKYTRPEAEKIYYFADYENNQTLTRIPDFRTQLYWNPSVEVNASSTTTLNFFTGDLPGTYVAEIVGFTSTGKQIYYTKEFQVTLKEGQ
jgi:hypothetical protein